MLKLTKSERTELQQQAETQNGRAEASRHAQLILLLADGLTWAEIRQRLNCSDSYIARWSKRFAAERLAGLYARHAGRERYKVTDRLEKRVLAHTTQQTPADGSRHWSSRKLAAELGGAISHMTVARIWAKHGIKPHRLESCLVPNEPAFEARAADVVGLYVHRPQHAAVFSVDKPQAALPAESAEVAMPPAHMTRSGARSRQGTRALYTRVKDRHDELSDKPPRRHTSAEFAAFLADIAAHQPPSRQTHVIADNIPVQKTRAITDLVASHPNLQLHFTATYAAWLNQVERTLAAIEQDLQESGQRSGMADLKRRLMRYIRRCNQQPQATKWKHLEPAPSLSTTVADHHHSRSNHPHRH